MYCGSVDASLERSIEIRCLRERDSAEFSLFISCFLQERVHSLE